MQVDFTDWRPLLAFVLCLACPAFATFVTVWPLYRGRHQHKYPFADLRRRPAGESLRLKIEALDEKILLRIFMAVLLPGMLAMGAATIRANTITAYLLPVAVAAIWSVAVWHTLLKLMEERRNYQLGFDGERYVAEELNPLIAEGFEIYHDVPFENFNMDHVLVGQLGVFVIETKTRKKLRGKDGEKKYTVTFDGTRLHWPRSAGDREVTQAGRNAETLSKWLTGAVGEPVRAVAILTIPGWYIERKAVSRDVFILNPKEICQICTSKGQWLSENLKKRVCHQLAQKCKLEIAPKAKD